MIEHLWRLSGSRLSWLPDANQGEMIDYRHLHEMDSGRIEGMARGEDIRNVGAGFSVVVFYRGLHCADLHSGMSYECTAVDDGLSRAYSALQPRHCLLNLPTDGESERVRGSKGAVSGTK